MSAHNILPEMQKAPFKSGDPGDGGTIRVDRWGMQIPLVIGAGAETGDLPNPTKEGELIVITARSVGGGSRAITAAGAINQAGNTVMTFAQARDTIILVSINTTDADTYRWQVLVNEGVALT